MHHHDALENSCVRMKTIEMRVWHESSSQMQYNKYSSLIHVPMHSFHSSCLEPNKPAVPDHTRPDQTRPVPCPQEVLPSVLHSACQCQLLPTQASFPKALSTPNPGCHTLGWKMAVMTIYLADKRIKTNTSNPIYVTYGIRYNSEENMLRNSTSQSVISAEACNKV